MQGFLECLAGELYKKYGDELSSLNILMPNNRARLFFSEALSKVAEKPIWQPNFLSVDALMGELSGLEVSDKVPLVAELYKVYSGFFPDESFDTFYFWGEMLLADFDSVDKYMLDARMLFTNVWELKDMERDLSYLTPEQVEVIKNFWQCFNQQRAWSKEQENFGEIWSKLFQIYTQFKDNLRAKGMAYSGMMYRDAVAAIKANGEHSFFGNKRFVVAGFNALSECEKKLFRYIQDKCESLFFWDYDKYYLEDKYQEAGLFMRDNLREFPQKISLGAVDNFSSEKKIRVVSVPSDALQCRYVNNFLSEIPSIDKRTVVVLTDENLLLPVIYSVPESVDNVNITMGYPLIQTLAYSFTERLLQLQKHKKPNQRFYHADVLGLLTHPYIKYSGSCERAEKLIKLIERRGQAYVGAENFVGDDILAKIFTSLESWQEISEYLIKVLSAVCEGEQSEDVGFFSLIIDHIYKITNSALGLEIELSVDIFVSLLRRTLQNIRVPYKGEPLLGLQVMGILETRNLDFENVIVLSVNDDNFPGNRNTSSSFIPYNLRMAYGLPTVTHHEGVYAYYFYRLLQRAKRIDLVYSTQSDDKKTGEKSRYIYQLDYESKHDIEFVNYELDVNLDTSEPLVVAKDVHVKELLGEYFDNENKIISPTAFYSYVECGLKFYFRYLAKLKKSDEISQEVDNPTFGNILHYAMKLLYTGIKGDVRPRAKELIGSEKVTQSVKEAIAKEYLKGDNLSYEQWGGNLLLVHDIVVKYINQCVLPYDSAHESFTIEQMEERALMPVKVDFDGEPRVIYVGGMVDRLDNLSAEKLRVVDYKTGSMHKEFAGIESLFVWGATTNYSAVLQTLIYSMVLNYNHKKEILPALYYVREMKDDNYSPLINDKAKKQQVTSFLEYKPDFERLFNEVVNEIFDLERSFSQCEDEKTCQWCDYKQICKR